MLIDNGRRDTLIIDGVFEGVAGIAGAFVSFIPNRSTRAPSIVRAGILGGIPVALKPEKEADSPFWTSRFEVLA